MAVSPTQLRENLYKILDEIISSREPVEITRKGYVIKLVLSEEPSPKKLSALKPHPGTILSNDPESIIHMDWSELWQGKLEL